MRVSQKVQCQRYVWALFLCVACLIPTGAHAADLSFSPASGTYEVGKEFSIKVTVVPGSDKINAADGEVSFAADALSVSGVSKDGSVFSLWTAEPSFSNSAGTLSFSGGTPAGFSTNGTVLTIKFKAKKTGTATLSFSKGSILAADGKGTDVYVKGDTASFTITEAVAAPAKDAAADDVPADASTDAAVAEDAGPPPIAPTIDSLTHPKPDSWYATSTAIFSWNPPEDVTGVRVLLSEKEDETPTQVLKGVATSSVQKGIKDGTRYFFVQYRNESGWGDIAKRKVLVDTVAPDEFDVALTDPATEGGVPQLAFTAQDALSGVDRYEIEIGGTVVATVLAKDLKDGAYPVPPQEGGMQTVAVRAYDMAGNKSEAKRDLELPKVDKPKPKTSSDTEEVAPQSLWTIERILTILFAMIIGAVGTLLYKARKSADQERLRLIQKVAEMADKNDRVFSAMREEFEQMINNFDERPQLTPAERDLLEEIKEVLDLSEEVIDTGIDELKKMIRGQ